MKKITIFILVLFKISTFSQTFDISEAGLHRIEGAYYEDTDDNLNQFEGEWLYSNGNTSLKFVLVKKVYAHTVNYHEDILIGEYQYIEDGVEKVNTLNLLDTVYPNQAQHRIAGSGLISNTSPPVCLDCLSNQKRIRLTIRDPVNQRNGSMVARTKSENGQEKLIIKIRYQGLIYDESLGTPPSVFSLPGGTYTLIKQ
jgi:hypothetical protein